MEKKKKLLTKILSGLLVFLLIFNFTTASFATNNEEAKQKENDAFDVLGGVVLDGLIGTLTSVIRIPIVLIGDAISVVLGLLGKSAGFTEGITEDDVGARLTPEDVLFNKLQLISINFFDLDGGTGSAGGAIQEIRKNVAIWYYAIRNIALGVLLCIFIYVAIRMTLSTVASDKAVYKKMLMDWLVGITLLFLLHYIIMGSIMLNNVLVEDVMRPALTASSASASGTLGDFTVQLRDDGTKIISSAAKSWGAAIVYIMVVFVTLTFLYKYIMRMLTIAFLIIISPLITITYSIDKMGDGKSQALNTWLKEFEYNILIQPFHCIMYMVFVKTAVDILDGTIAGMVLAIFTMKFIWDGEKIIKNIFGFNNAKSVGDSLVAAGGALTAMNMVGNAAKSATVGAGGGSIKGTGGNGGGGGNLAAKSGAGAKQISGSATQTPKLKNTDAMHNALGKNSASNMTQGLRATKNDTSKGLGQRALAGAALGAVNAGNAIGGAIGNKVRSGINTIKGAAKNPGLAARQVMRGSLKAAFMGVAAGAALATGNLGMVPAAMKAGGAIGGYVGQKADAIPARVSRAESEAKFRDNARQSGQDLKDLDRTGISQSIKDKAAQKRRDEHGKKMTADKAFGESSVDDMLQDYKEHGSEHVNEQYNDAVNDYISTFGSGKGKKDLRDEMTDIANMSVADFETAMTDPSGRFAGMNDDQKATLFNYYDASQRKNLIDNADRMQGEEQSLGNADAQKDVYGMMNEEIFPPPPTTPPTP